jgi:hypothetical protein
MLFSIILTLCFAQTTISEIVGTANGQAITSREVEADVVFTALYQKVDKPNYFLPLKGKALQSATSNLLMEVLIVAEAQSFKLAPVSDAEVARAISTFQANLPKSNLQKNWKALALGRKEIQALAARKLRAVRFLELKKTTFITSPTDEEIKDYFDKRKSNFQGKSLSEVRETLDKNLKQDKLDQSLREWFQVLRSKYEIRNLLIES